MNCEHCFCGKVLPDGRQRCCKCGMPTLTHDEAERARRFERLFRKVPLNDVEKLPDPDYGL